MKGILRSSDRGYADHGWLESRHTFSFAGYYNPSRMGFLSLRVINEDFIEGGQGFGLHGHQNMEIMTYMVSGALRHRDTLGNEAVIRPGEVQLMSAGSGIRHSEFNDHTDVKAHLLQIWIVPNLMGESPSYAQKNFSAELTEKGMVRVVSAEGLEGSLKMRQDIDIWVGKTRERLERSLTVHPHRGLWLQAISGTLSVDGELIGRGDGWFRAEEGDARLIADPGAEFLLFDMASMNEKPNERRMT